MPSKTKIPKQFRISLPATSANLGPAFDAAALAMDFYIKIDAHPAREFSITATGRDREICGALKNHLILHTYGQVLEAAGRHPTPLSLGVANDIPIGKGCGSSAAARPPGVAPRGALRALHWPDPPIHSDAAPRPTPPPTP